MIRGLLKRILCKTGILLYGDTIEKPNLTKILQNFRKTNRN